MSDLTDFYSELGSKQRDQRVKRYYTDQFGRRYFAWADKQNQRPIGEFVLSDLTGNFVTAPWNPPMSYIEWPDADGLEFRWKFEHIAQELSSATAEWYSEAQKLAKFIHVNVPEVGGDCAPELIGILGAPPLTPEIPLACDAGEPWIIGRKGARVNTRLQTLVNLGRSITSTLALDTIRERVRVMMESQYGLTADGVLNIPAATIGAVLSQSPSDAPSAEPNFYEFMALETKNGVSVKDAQAKWRERSALASV